MANQEQIDIITQGVEAWNQWRKEHADSRPNLIRADLHNVNLSGTDLSGANLSEANLNGADLSGTDLSGANLSEANLSGTDLHKANLSEANLSGAKLVGTNLSETNLQMVHLYGVNLNEINLSRADLMGANLGEAYFNIGDLSEANLTQANLSGATFRGTDLSGADLSGADLSGARLVGADLTRATLTNCSIYAISVWDVQLQGAIQVNLVITPIQQPRITVDNLEVAQFIYLLLNNPKIRDVIDTIAKKAVLILGRFAPERKVVLDALRDELRKQDYLPILFDFEKPSSRNLTETVRTLAHLARFIIADLTDPGSIPQELYAIVPTLAVAVQPVLLEGKREYAMSIDLLNTYHWMLPVHFYKDQNDLLTTLKTKVIDPAEQKAQELEKR